MLLAPNVGHMHRKRFDIRTKWGTLMAQNVGPSNGGARLVTPKPGGKPVGTRVGTRVIRIEYIAYSIEQLMHFSWFAFCSFTYKYMLYTLTDSRIGLTRFFARRFIKFSDFYSQI